MKILNLSTLAVALIIFLGSCGQKNTDKETQESKSTENSEKANKDQATMAEKAGVDLPGLEKDKPRKNEEVPTRKALDKLTKLKAAKPKETPAQSAAMPDFKSIQNTDERKALFINFMKPIIKAENADILQDRYLIAQIYKGIQEGDSLAEKDEKWLREKAKYYRVKNTTFPSDEAFKDLLMHVDIIPMDLAIAQAINESAWGTSRFARIGNNMYGQWCFKPGCGVVPAQRKEGATHEVAVFPTVAGSVKSYMHHVNSHPAYQQLRVLRYKQRVDGKQPDGHTIALGLQKYSAIGMKYVNILRSMMEKNADLIEG